MCPTQISMPLKVIFDKSLESGVYPSTWKLANLQPVHKKKSRQVVGNYRPISILPICGKIFEKVMFHSMYSFLVANSLLTKNQSGYRPGDSCIINCYQSQLKYSRPLRILTRLGHCSWTYLRPLTRFGTRVYYSSYSTME